MPDVIEPRNSGRKKRRDPVAFDARSGRGRDVPREVATRLARAGFRARPELDGVFAVRG